MSQSDVRVTIYSPNAQKIQVLDCAQSDFGGGSIRYEDLPTGCGSGELLLGLRFEEIINRGYWTARNIVEISTGDDVLASPIALGATVIPTANPHLYDPALGEDAQQIYLYDGGTLAMLIPVLSVGATSINVGQPHDVNGLPYAMPSFGAGTIIGRRRYAGYIMRRDTPNMRQPRATITLAGLSRRLNEAIGTFTYNAQDVGAAIGITVDGFTSRYPELGLGSFPAVGSLYTGSRERVSVLSMCNEILSAIINGDQWVLRVGHDRKPRLIKLYTSATNTYTYNTTLDQGVSYVEPQTFKQVGEDASRLFNSVEVIGDTNVSTKQPARAIVQDALSISLYGQIDAAPITNTACKTDAAAATYAKAVLLQQSLAIADNTFRVYTHNDNHANGSVAVTSQLNSGLLLAFQWETSSNTAKSVANVSQVNSGLLLAFQWGTSSTTSMYTPSQAAQLGDVVRAVSNVIVQRFDGGSAVSNYVPDSEIRYGSGVEALWYNGSGMNVVVGVGPAGSNEFSATAATASITSGKIDVAPTQVWSWDAYLDASAITSGSIAWQVVNVQTGTALSTVSQAAGASGVRVSAKFTIPSGCFSIYVKALMNGAVGKGIFAQPNMNAGSVLIPYVANFSVPDVYGLPSTVVSTFDAHGDSYQDVRFAAVQPDANAALSERANALATAIVANTASKVGIDSYVISYEGFGYSYSGLVVTVPSFFALFAQGSPTQPVGGNTFTLQPSTTNWVSLNPGNSWTVRTDPSPVAGAILFAIFTTSATAVVGSINKAPIGVFKVGVGSVNFAADLPAPTFGAATVTNSTSVNGVAADVSTIVPLTNVPQDGSAFGVQYYFRVSGTTPWVPYGGDNLTGMPSPPASQTASFDYGSLSNGQSYDFAIGYIGIGGYGALTVFQSNFAATEIGVPTSYLLGGNTTLVPTIGPGSVVTEPSANGLNAAVAVSTTITNQPTDGSLSRVEFWFRKSSQNNGVNTIGATGFYWQPMGGQPATGVGTSSPPSSSPYSQTNADLTNGETYDFAISMENAQGGESVLGVIALNYVATAITISPGYIVDGSLVTPTVSGGNGTGSPSIVFTKSAFSSQFRIDFRIGNQPTDNSLGKIIFYYRLASGAPPWIPVGTSPPRDGSVTSGNGAALVGGATSAFGNYAVTVPAAANGQTYEFGVALASVRGSESAIVSLGTSLAPIGVPSGTSVSITAGTTPTVVSSTSTLQQLNFTLSYVVSGTTDMTWLSKVVLYSYFYDPTSPGLIHVGVETRPALVTSASVSLGSQVIANSSSSPIFRYGFFLRFVAVDGSYVDSNQFIYTAG